MIHTLEVSGDKIKGFLPKDESELIIISSISLKILNIITGEILFNVNDLGDESEISEDKNLLITFSVNKVKIWNINERKLIKILNSPNELILFAKFSQKGRKLTFYASKEFKILDTIKWKLIKKI